MKTIGMLGGMSWESSLEYYRILNETVKERLGGLHSAKCVMVSVDFAEIEDLQQAGKWDQATNLMIQAARQVVAGGADCLLICTNTMHLMADAVQEAISVPLLHIADATAEAIKGRGVSTTGLLGTRFTMDMDFYRGRLESLHGLKVLVPEEKDKDFVHHVIYNELCLGRVRDTSKRSYLRIIDRLAAEGAEAVILGCTEIGLLVKSEDSPVPLFDTTRIHAQAAVDFALD
jgi:aspartate racemase